MRYKFEFSGSQLKLQTNENFNYKKVILYFQLSKKPAGAVPSAAPSKSVLDSQLQKILLNGDISKSVVSFKESAMEGAYSDPETPQAVEDDYNEVDEEIEGVQSFLQVRMVKIQSCNMLIFSSF